MANSPDKSSIVSITGGTGLIGSRLISKLSSQGSKVRVLTRDPASAKKKLQPILVGSQTSNVEFFAPADWKQGIRGSTACINLAGEPIATRWTESLKKEIMRSRVDATSRLVKEISALSPEERPKLLLSSSAVGFYGISQTSTFTEDSPSGSDYLAQVCREWEAAASGAKALGLRTVVMRTGIVLAREGGALGKMLPIFSLFAGGPLGTGKQWMSWIHREDLVDLILLAIEDESFDGVYNATAPRPIRMSEFCSTLGSLMGRPSWLPVPDFALLTILGEGASVVLEGQKVLPTRTQAQGFKFQYTDIEPALKNLLR